MVKSGIQKEGNFEGILGTKEIHEEKSFKKYAKADQMISDISKFGNFLKYFFTITAINKVVIQTIIVYILKFIMFEKIISQLSKNSVHFGISIHKTPFIWLVTINNAAQAVNHITTVWETKSTIFHIFTSQKINWYNQAKKVKTNVNWMNSGLQTSANPFMVLKTTSDIAVVGQDIKCLEDQKIAAIIGVTMAVYSQYSAGNQAIVANAIHCGKTIIAQVIQAIISAFKVFVFLTSFIHDL